MTMYIGLDVHSKKTVYAVQNEAGEVISEGRITTTEEGFQDLLVQAKVAVGTQIGLETGTQATWVSRVLYNLKMKPVVIDSREVRAKTRRIGQKSDRRDAFEICDGLRRGIYTSIVYIPPPEIQCLREIISRRRHFVSLCTRQVNAARFLLRSRGCSQQGVYLKRWTGWERLLEESIPFSLKKHLGMHAELWRSAHQQVSILEEELKDALEPFTDVANRLLTVPGVGLITAATFIASLGTPERFPDSAHVVSYVGLAVSTYNTGESCRHGHITKRGSAELRAMLCEAAHHAANPRHPLNPYFRRACSIRGYKIAVVNVAQRLARILFQLWNRQEDFCVTKLNVVAENKLLTRRVHYRIKESREMSLSH